MPWDRELHVLEEAIRRLNAEYDAFLYGSVTKPPVETQRHVREMIRRLNANPSDSAADRFRFSTLQGRYNALLERWERLQSEKEAGRRPGLYGHFASAPSPSPANAPAVSSVRNGEDVSALGQSDLYERYLEAKKLRGEDVSGYSRERFLESLEKQREKLRQQFGEDQIEFDVAEREGRIRLVARRKIEGPKSDVQSPKS
jgi:hypothetical protein